MCTLIVLKIVQKLCATSFYDRNCACVSFYLLSPGYYITNQNWPCKLNGIRGTIRDESYRDTQREREWEREWYSGKEVIILIFTVKKNNPIKSHGLHTLEFPIFHIYTYTNVVYLYYT